MVNIFISHATADSAIADTVCGWLKEAGHDVFLDFDFADGIEPGDDWEQSLYRHLNWADVLVAVVTRNYLASPWCAAEVGIARHRGNRVIPLIVESGVRHPLLDSLQSISARGSLLSVRDRLIQIMLMSRTHGSGGLRDGNPYPGLRALEADEASVFFGRSRDSELICSMLRSPDSALEYSVLVVTGPSGCGKSSLIQAGVMATLDMESDWHVLPSIRPGTHPQKELANAIAAQFRASGKAVSVNDVLDYLAASEASDSIWSQVYGEPPRRRILIVLDQLEELFTLATDSERIDFVSALRKFLTPSVRIVATLRPEFIDSILAAEEFDRLRVRLHPIRALDGAGLRSIVEGPARIAGIDVPERLVARILEDAGVGGALPLVAFSLRQLAAGVKRGEALSEHRYVESGGVQGALKHQADVALAESMRATEIPSSGIIALLLRLVTLDDNGTPTRWRIPLSGLKQSERSVYEEFLLRRLLSTESFNGEVFITVAHEAFLSQWSPLATAIVDSRSRLLVVSGVEKRAYEWDQDGRDYAGLLAGTRLEAVESLLRSETEEHVLLSGLAVRYVAESVRKRNEESNRERSRKRTLQGMLGASAVLFLACLAVLSAIYIITIGQLDANLLGRAKAAATGEIDPRVLTQVPPRLVGAEDILLALVFSDATFASVSGPASAPPIGRNEVDVARGVNIQSVRTASRDGVQYRVVAVSAGPGQALVIGEDLRPTLSSLGTTAAVMSIPAALSAIVAVLSWRALIRQRRKVLGSDELSP